MPKKRREEEIVFEIIVKINNKECKSEPVLSGSSVTACHRYMESAGYGQSRFTPEGNLEAPGRVHLVEYPGPREPGQGQGDAAISHPIPASICMNAYSEVFTCPTMSLNGTEGHEEIRPKPFSLILIAFLTAIGDYGFWKDRGHTHASRGEATSSASHQIKGSHRQISCSSPLASTFSRTQASLLFHLEAVLAWHPW